MNQCSMCQCVSPWCLVEAIAMSVWQCGPPGCLAEAMVSHMVSGDQQWSGRALRSAEEWIITPLTTNNFMASSFYLTLRSRRLVPGFTAMLPADQYQYPPPVFGQMNFNLFHILPSIGIQSLCWSMCNVMILFVQHRELIRKSVGKCPGSVQSIIMVSSTVSGGQVMTSAI